jgi:hypothetical protein
VLAPQLTGPPAGQSLLVGQTASFAVTTSASGVVQFCWQRLVAGTWTALSDDGHVSGAGTRVLAIRPLRLADAGAFRVIVTSPCGTTVSDVAALSVSGITGDLDCDGAVDFRDINPFVAALTSAGAYAQQYPDCDVLLADIDHDGRVSFADINPFVALLTTGR